MPGTAAKSSKVGAPAPRAKRGVPRQLARGAPLVRGNPARGLKGRAMKAQGAALGAKRRFVHEP